MVEVNNDKLCDSVLGVLIPPVLMYMKKKCITEFWISLVLYILFFPASIVYTFHVLGYKDICENVLTVLLPPVTAYLHHKCAMEFWISVVLWFFFSVPSTIYVYYLTW